MQESKYKPEYCEKLKEHMSKGRSIETFGVTVGVTRATVYNWCEKHEDFAKAKDEAMQLAQEFFESKLEIKLNEKDSRSKNIDTTCLIFALKTRFHKTYGEKQQIEHNISSIQIDDDDKAV